MNPFRYGQIVRDEYFCERSELSELLNSYIERGQNVLVQGERRVGKSSLISQTINGLTKYRLLYIDLLEVKTADDFVKRIVTAIMSMEKEAGFLERVFQKLSSLKPVVSMDPLTGMPTMSVDSSVRFSPDNIPGIMDMVFSYSSKSKPLVVVFDEFQDVLNLPNADATLALLRSKIQFHADLPYIFAGSVRNKMDMIFTSPDSAFFKSALVLDVGPLGREEFLQFLTEKFANGWRNLPAEIGQRLFDICFEIPGDVQQLCGALWDCTAEGEEVTASHLPMALDRIFAHESKSYEMTLKIITGQQLRFLTNLARLGGKAPTSAKFLKESGISQPSSIRTALKRLQDLKILFHHSGEYRFVNPFFRAWLLHKGL